MTLGEKQRLFVSLLPGLFFHAKALGYELSLGDAYRDPRVHGEWGVKMGYGHPKSVHKVRLGIDLNLYKDGRYILDDEGHKELGEWWKKQNDLCKWGGDFPINDFNHYSFEHEGVA